ncbi:hypothetical protein C2845_PM05G01550 [Panicum miliaceum]|uniref:Uncharacterized protein n=1 Tax=Panicum miliaceum TaxID=4540 RepID=A0A3L6SZU5_PANMI|nr:hypothetical protein C2845_PM05G01550 [Panicum miliaceum]
MGVRGLGVSVVTWTTVVLLGGFVSDLPTKDFWCLTGITLVQAAGVFNFLLKEKLSDMLHSWWGLLATVFATVKEEEGEFEGKNKVIAYILAGVQGLVLCIVLCPLGVLYMLGLYISAGVSLWRLVEHDFGNAGGANQKPALQVLYSLAVAQGVLFGYKTIHALMSRTRLPKLVAELAAVDEELVAEYLEETVAGCEKDSSFATGRNLVTYGVELMMEAKSNEGFIAGLRVLAGAIKDDYWRGRKVLVKHLLTRHDSSSHMILRRLLETVGPRSPYSREIKEHVVRILALVARGIRLEQFPRAIECLSSVVDTSDEEYSRRSSNGDNTFKDYERVELLEEYERGYLVFDRESQPAGSLLGNSGSLIQRLVQLLPCKTKAMENNGRGDGGSRRRPRTNTAAVVVHGFDELLTEALNIIHQILVHEDNRWIMRACVSNTVLHRIAMFPRKLHKDGNHDACSVFQESELHMLEKCWVLTEWLLVTMTEANDDNPSSLQPATPLLLGGGGRRSISGEEGEIIIQDQEVVEEPYNLLWFMVGSALGNAITRTIKNSMKGAIKSIFDCLDCRATQKKQGIQILLHLSLDMSFITEDSESSKRRLTWTLLLIVCSTHDDSMYWRISGFIDRSKNMCDFDRIRELAGEKLRHILGEKRDEIPAASKGSTEIELLQSVRLALGDLARAFADDALYISMRTHAAIIMEGLCIGYTTYTNLAEEVEGFLVAAIPKVVNEILILCAPTIEERQAQASTDVVKDGVSHECYMDNERRRLRKALVSLYTIGYMRDVRLRPKFEETASKICKEQGRSFEDFESLRLNSSAVISRISNHSC